jgi:hypothetical protein
MESYETKTPTGAGPGGRTPRGDGTPDYSTPSADGARGGSGSGYEERADRAGPYRELAPSGRPVGRLVTDLSKQVGSLFQKEGALARAELREKLSQLGAGAAELGTGALLSFAGLVLLLHAAALAIALAIENTWLAYLIVGGATLLIGMIVLARGRSNLKTDNLAPERTAASLRRDADLARTAAERAQHTADPLRRSE